jgi:hypothetical protein
MLLACLRATLAGAHGANLVVSRDEAKPPRLHVNGRVEYLSQSKCSEMIAGDGGAGFWFTDAPGISALPQDGILPGRHPLGPRHRLALQMVRTDEGFSLVNPVTWKQVLKHNGERYELPRNAQGDFGMQMISRSTRIGTFRATFRFVDLSGRYAPSDEFTLCFVATGVRDRPDARITNVPTTFLGAVEDMRLRLHEVGTWLSDGRTSPVADESSALLVIAESLGRLAKADSGVAKGSLPQIESAAANTRATVVRLHQSSDLGDLGGTREQYGQLRNQLAILTGFLPRTYACPMGCEQGKTYPVARQCPVCGMKLADTRAHLDHEPRHGGVFMMSPDMAHHLEVTLGRDGTLRLYAYDEYTRPITVAGVRARVSRAATPKSAASSDPPRPISLSASKDRSFLGASVPFARPVRVAVVVDFGAGAGEEAYDVEFAP